MKFDQRREAESYRTLLLLSLEIISTKIGLKISVET